MAASVVVSDRGRAIPAAPSGAAVLSRSCSICHSLIGAESLHTPGG